jgi:hypothetical protein
MNKTNILQASTEAAQTRSLFSRHTRRSPLVGFREQQIQDWKQEAHNPDSQLWKTLVLYASAAHMQNELALDYTLEAVEEVKKTPLFKQDIKKQVRAVEAEMNKYNARIWAELTNGTDDSAIIGIDRNKEKFVGKLNNALTRFYYAIKQSLDDHRIPHSAMFAQLETADDLLGMACLSLENNRKDPLVRPFMQRISTMDLSVLRRQLQILEKKMLSKCGVDERLLVSHRALDAWKVLCKEVLNYETSIVPLLEEE